MMSEQREFHRVTLAEKCAMAYQEIVHQGEIENISLSGALIRFTDSVFIQVGGACFLTVHIEGGITPLRLDVEIVHSNLSVIGIRFVSIYDDGRDRLIQMVERYTTEPDRLATEMERIRVHIANYLQAS